MVTVAASMYAVTTQASRSMPPRSPTIVGSAVETIVWSSDASSITSSSAPKIRRTRCAGRRSWTAAIRTGLPAYVHERHHRLAVQQLCGLDLGAGALHARAEGLEERVGRLEEVHRGRAEVHRHHEPRPDRPHELGGGPAADRRTAADGHHQHVDRAQRRALLRPQCGLTQVAEVAAAQAAELEAEDRVRP